MTSVPRPTWVHPALLRAACMVPDADDLGVNPWLQKGTHLRVFASAELGYPLCPFTVWQAGETDRDEHDVLSSSGDHVSSVLESDELVVGAWSGRGSLSVLDAAGRTSGRCSRSYPFVARVPLPGFRYVGDGVREWARLARYVRGLTVDDETGAPWTPSWLDDDPIDAIGAPLPDDGAWWCGIDTGFASHDQDHRVRAGVPDVALPYDRHQPADAYERARALAAPIEADVAAAWADSWEAPPAAWPLSRDLPGHQGATATTTVGLVLSAASVDVAAARWWGFGTTLRYRTSVSEWAECFAVAALFALHPTDSNRPLMQLARATRDDPMSDPFMERLFEVHESRGLRERVQTLTDAGHEIVSLWTIAVASPPPDVPDPPTGSVPSDRRTWNNDGTWAATLAVRGAAGGPLAVIRDAQSAFDDPVPRNELVRPDAPDPPWRQPIVAPELLDDPTAVAFTDGTCPGGSASWQVRAADLWGQWSEPGQVASDPPDVAEIPAPTVVLELLAGALPVGTGAASAGRVAIRVTLPPPAPNAPPIWEVRATLTGAASPVTLAEGVAGLWTGHATVAATTPGGSVPVRCTATASDTIGRSSTAAASLVVHDPRPFAAPLTSGALLFTGDRRPDGFAELDLRAPIPAGTPGDVTWRVYVADEQALDVAPTGAEPRWSRANRLRTQVDASATRRRMAQLPSAVVTAAGGTLRLRARLPGRLESVQVLQLVATTSTGLEAPSNRSGSFAVAIPLGDSPPAPTLTQELTAGGSTVSVHVIATYPGTRPAGNPAPGPMARRGAPASTPLRARIRRSAAGGGDPRTWPIVATVDLPPANPAAPGSGWRWAASVADVLPATTPAWSPLAYACEVAWPDEPAWNPAATPVAGAVAPTWGPIGPRRSAWSAPSTALTVLAPRPTVAVAPHFVDHGDGTATISVTVPVGHPRMPPWTLTAMPDAVAGLPPLTASGPGPLLRIPGVDATVGAGRWLLALTAPDGTVQPMVAADGTTP